MATFCILLIVRHLNDGRTLFIELFEKLHDFSALAGVKIASRLIGQNQLGAGDHCARDCDQLLLTAGKLIGEEILFAHDVKAVEHITDNGLPFGFFDIAIGEWNLEVFIDGEGIDQVVALKDKAHVFFVDLGALLFT